MNRVGLCRTFGAFAVSLFCVMVSPAQGLTVRASTTSGGFLFSLSSNARELHSASGQAIVGIAHGGSMRMEAGFLSVIGGPEASASTISIGIAGGWNLVSVPLTVSSYAKATLFPTATSSAFAYQGGYVAQAVLANGEGYWIKFGSSQNASISGFPRGLDSVTVLSGWNLIGSISSPVPASGIGSVPGGIVTSQIFGYNAGGYAVATVIEPGKGYWIKVSQNGRLVLSSSSPAETLIRIVPTSELPPPPPGNEAPGAADVPTKFALEQNYPNPFNPVTTITFALPPQAGNVGTLNAMSLQIFDLLGRRVATLLDEPRQPGRYSVTFDASNLATGIYVYRLTAGSLTATRRMMLMK
jgi:hypothetical protein